MSGNIERRLSTGEIDFFVTEQIFNGYVGMDNEHEHDYYEIFYVEKGSRILYLNDIPYILGPQNIAIIPPGFSHRTTSLNETEQRLKFYGFSKDFFDGYIAGKNTEELFANHNVTMHIEEGDVQTVVSMMNKLIDLYNNIPDEFSKIKEQSIIFDMIFNYSDYHKNGMIDDIYDKSGNQTAKTKFLMISRYIKKHLNEKITLSLLEDVFEMNKYEISRNFKKYCGSTFADYLNSVRIDTACSILSNTGARVDDVAMTVGYESASHFSKMFKKYMDMSPKQFAKNSRK